jgi:drug/metabolite transporter (DMT)-like permease
MGLVESILGIFCGLLAGLMFTIGAVLQKKGVQDLPAIQMANVKSMTPMLKNRTWLLGIVIGSVGGAPYILSQLWIGIGYTQLLIADGLILLAYMASRMLKEPLGKIEYLGFSLIFLGIIFLGLAQLQPTKVTLSDPTFIVNVLIFYTPFWIAILAGLIFYKLSDFGAGKILAALSGIIFGCGAGFSQIGSLGLKEGNWFILLFGFLILIIGTVLGTLVANVAYQKEKAVIVIPVQSAGNYLIPVIAGLLLFRQVFFSFESGFWFWPSIIFIMAGVFLLSRIQAKMEQKSANTESSSGTPTTATSPNDNIQ